MDCTECRQRPATYLKHTLCQPCYKKGKYREEVADPEKKADRLRRATARRKDREQDSAYLAMCKAKVKAALQIKKQVDPAWAAKDYAKALTLKKKYYRDMRPEAKAEILRRQRRRNTGWTEGEREDARARQLGVCEICPRPLGPGRGMQSDHYETLDGVRCKHKAKGAKKHPRALLCAYCNSGLGHYEAGQRSAGLRIEAYEAYIAKYGG